MTDIYKAKRTLQARWNAQREQAQEAQRQAAEAEAARIQEAKSTSLTGVTMNDEQRQIEIIERHARAAKAELEAEEKRSADEKAAQSLTREIETIAGQLIPLQRFPSKYRAEIDTLAAQLDAKQRELDALTGRVAPVDHRTTGNRNFQIFGGRISHGPKVY